MTVISSVSATALPLAVALSLNLYSLFGSKVSLTEIGSSRIVVYKAVSAGSETSIISSLVSSHYEFGLTNLSIL